MIAAAADAATVMAAGADYVEPTIVGNLLVQDDSGAWVLDEHGLGPALAHVRRAPPS